MRKDVMMEGRGEKERGRQRKRVEDAMLLALKMEKRPPAKKCGRPLEDGKGKDTDSSLGHPEETQP